jgi:hypothetical protein
VWGRALPLVAVRCGGVLGWNAEWVPVSQLCCNSTGDYGKNNMYS